MESELNNVDMDEAAKLFAEDGGDSGETLKSNTKSIDTSKKNRSKSPSTTKNKKTKKSENKNKKKKKNKAEENKINEKENNSLELNKSIDKDKNEEIKEEEEGINNKEEKEEKNEEKSEEKNGNENPAKNENNEGEGKKNKKKKKNENEEDKNVKANSTVTQNEKKEKKKGKGKKKKTSDGAGEGEDSKNEKNQKSKTRGKSKDKSKVKKKEEIKIDDPKKYVYDYMKTQNRPYSLINIFDNLHGAIKKSQLGKILDALVEEGSLIMKEYNTKIYLFNQDKLDVKITDSDIDAIQKEIDEKKEEHKKLKEVIASKANELKILTLSLTDEELKSRIKELKKELSKMKIKVDNIKENKIDPIPPEKMKEAKENFEKELKIFKKTKKICVEIINDISDGMELKIKDTYDKIGIENDDELIKQLNIDQNLINGK